MQAGQHQKWYIKCGAFAGCPKQPGSKTIIPVQALTQASEELVVQWRRLLAETRLGLAAGNQLSPQLRRLDTVKRWFHLFESPWNELDIGDGAMKELAADGPESNTRYAATEKVCLGNASKHLKKIQNHES